MVRHGTCKVYPDHRDRSHTRTFGAIAPITFPDSFDTDAHLTNPNQEVPNPQFDIPALPYGCTGYTSSELCIDQDKQLYNPLYTYDWTRFMEGTQGQDVGCDIRDALKSTVVYGVEAKGETSQMQAFQHRRGAYYAVEPAPDYFDGIRSALMKSGSVSIGTPYYSEWARVGKDGIVPPTNYGMNTNNLPWHNWKICGWKQIGGQPHLIAKTWQGPEYGDNGFSYYSRADINAILDVYYTGAFVVDRYTTAYKPVVLSTLWEVVLSYLRRIALLK